MGRLGEQLEKARVNPSIVFQSRIARSRESAGILASRVGGTLWPPSCRFCELHPGSLDSLRFSSLPNSPIDPVRDESHPMAYGAESWLAMKERVLHASNELFEGYGDSLVALVTHQGYIRALFEQHRISSRRRMGSLDDYFKVEGRAVLLETRRSRLVVEALFDGTPPRTNRRHPRRMSEMSHLPSWS